ncbi:MAG TPA: PAS domain S-box protein [Gammaproteobacteria bacterium]|nr:PAS domain S-box protein [Gammaproteobacteria bacterium]
MTDKHHSQRSRLQGQIAEKHFRGMIESTAGIPWVVDLENFQFTYVGPQAEQILGYPVEQWYENDFWAEHIHPDDRQAAIDYCVKASQKGKDYNFEYRMIHREGHEVWILDYVHIATENGVPVQLQGFMFDVTQSRQLETELIKNKTRLEEAQRLAKLGSWELDLGSGQLLWSDEIFRIFEIDPKKFDASYEAFLEAIHPDDREMVDKAYRQSLADKLPYHMEHRLLMPDGRIKYVIEHCKTEYGPDGQPLRSTGTVQDITQSKLVEQQLRDSNAHLKALYQASPDMVFIHARDGRILDVNQNAARRYGYSQEEMRTLTVPDVSANPDCLDQVAERVQQALRDERPDFEWLAKDSDNRPFPVEVRLRKLHAGNGPDDPALIAVIRDISERKRTEESIKNIAAGVSGQSGKAFYLNMVKSLSRLFNADYAFIGLLDENNPRKVNTLAVFAHGAIAENFSYPLDDTPCGQMVGKSTCYHPHDVQQAYPKDDLLVDMGIDSYIGSPLFDSHNQPLGLIAVMDGEPMQANTQLTEILEIFAARAASELERDKTHQHLKNAQQKLALHVLQTPLGVIEWDTDFRVTDWNPAAERIFGFSKEEALGKTAKELIIPDDFLPHVDGIWQALLENRGGSRSTNGNLTKDGTAITCDWYNTPLVTDDGKVIGVASLVSDVTERINTAAELETHREHLEDLVKLRTMELSNINQELEAFSYSVSHDLRAPLRHIDGFSQVLEEDYAEQLDEDGRRQLQRIRQSAQRMGQLIDDLLVLSRVSRGAVERETLNLSSMVEDIINKLKHYDSQREVTIDIQSGITCHADHRLVHVLLENLLGNAWKYTAKTQHAHIRFSQQTNEQGEVVFCLQDNGAGFDMKYADKLFSAFKRLHSDHDFEGTGIGLATVQRIINRHGGRVWAEAEVGRGANFYFTLGSVNPQR